MSITSVVNELKISDSEDPIKKIQTYTLNKFQCQNYQILFSQMMIAAVILLLFLSKQITLIINARITFYTKPFIQQFFPFSHLFPIRPFSTP